MTEKTIIDLSGEGLTPNQKKMRNYAVIGVSVFAIILPMNKFGKIIFIALLAYFALDNLTNMINDYKDLKSKFKSLRRKIK